MKNRLIQSILLIIGLYMIGLYIGATAFGDDTNPRHREHSPPPQAYEDCKGKKAGDKVQHTTREGKVEATCVDSPEGLVARPDQLPKMKPDTRPRQDIKPQSDADTGSSQ